MNYLNEIKKNEFFKNVDGAAFDGLTKVINRDKIFEYMNYLIKNNKPFIFCMMDIDNFKYINDTQGHLIGDYVLRDVANAIIEGCGDEGVIGRFGGDEFMVIYEDEDISYDNMWEYGKKLNHCVDEYVFESVPNLKITLTTGVTCFPKDAHDFEDIFNKADRALYRGKSKGRNCFIVYVHEKHKDITMKSRNDIKINSTYMFMQVFDLLNRNKKFKKNITELLSYLSNNLLIDHLCIQSNNQIIFDYVHSLSRLTEFKYIDTNILYRQMNSYGISNINQITGAESIHKDLFEKNQEQKILAQLCFSIKYDGVSYGVIRADMCTSNRIWQTEEFNLLITVANTLALIIKVLDINLDDL